MSNRVKFVAREVWRVAARHEEDEGGQAVPGICHMAYCAGFRALVYSRGHPADGCNFLPAGGWRDVYIFVYRRGLDAIQSGRFHLRRGRGNDANIYRKKELFQLAKQPPLRVALIW